MAEDTQHQIEERLAELPEEIRSAVLSAELGNHVHEIGQHHGLHIDQVGKLQDETMLVMLGFFDLDQFETQLSEQLVISKEDAAAIAHDINTSIFLPIRESLKQFAEKKRAGVQEAHIPPAPPAPTMPAAEHMLTEKTVVRPIYKADPYREPIE